MKNYKFKHVGAVIHLRGRDPISPENLTDAQVDELVKTFPELRDQFEGLPELKPEKVEKAKPEKDEEKKN